MPSREGDTYRGVVTVSGWRVATRRGFKTRRDAREWEIETRKEYLATLEQERRISDSLLALTVEYLEHSKRFSQHTYDQKYKVCKRLLADFGESFPVEDVTPAMIERFLMQRAAECSNSASNKDRKNLHAMWVYGEDFLGLKSNPVRKVKALSHDPAPQYTPPEEDVLKVLMVAKPEEKVILKAYLTTAARKSELFRWRWDEDINFEARRVRLGTRKTRDGSMKYIWLPMNNVLYEALWWWWKNRPLKDVPWVFYDTAEKSPHYGQPFTTRRRFMRGLCKRAGVKAFGFHALRRHTASLLADKHKVSSKTVQEMLRHQSIQTTEKYIHRIRDNLTEAANALNDIGQPTQKKDEGEDQKNG